MMRERNSVQGLPLRLHPTKMCQLKRLFSKKKRKGEGGEKIKRNKKQDSRSVS